MASTQPRLSGLFLCLRAGWGNGRLGTVRQVAHSCNPMDGDANARGSEEARRAVSRHAQRYLLRRKEDFGGSAENGEGRSERRIGCCFEKHHTETEGQIERLEEVFAEIEAEPRGKKCAAIEGIIEEGQEIIKEYKGSPAFDAGLLAAAQAVEHYEISRYGTLKAWAEKLGLDNAVNLLEATLDEEELTDETLTEIAKMAVNAEAEDEEEKEEEE